MPDHDICPTPYEDGIDPTFSDTSTSDLNKIWERCMFKWMDAVVITIWGVVVTTCTFLASSCGLEFIVVAYLNDGARGVGNSPIRSRKWQNLSNRGEIDVLMQRCDGDRGFRTGDGRMGLG